MNRIIYYTKCLIKKHIFIPKDIFLAFDRLIQWDIYNFDYDRDKIIDMIQLPEEIVCYMYINREYLLSEFLIKGKKQVIIK